MYIKQIIIQGFKSYKDQTEIAPFSSKDNVIVGKNGSGKSNFFAAVRFVLGDSYTSMTREDRASLLHEGSGSAVQSAYVEVIFDNSDQRFPTGKDETILRRTIGMKKDEYSIDRKNSTKTEVANMLESAGFSRSNPYYIVPQGRITALTNMKDEQRLALLKDVAGTQVYETRKQESTKILNDTNNKRSTIDDLLGVIEDRLGELEQEKEELRAFQEQDKEKRSLEYTYHYREQLRVLQQLDTLNERRQARVDEQENRTEEKVNVEERITDLERDVNKISESIKAHKENRRQYDAEVKAAVQEETRLTMEIEDLKGEEQDTDRERRLHNENLKTVQKEITTRENELKKLLPGYNDTRQKEVALKTRLEADEIALRTLREKAQYSSKADRDAALRKQLEAINADLTRRKAYNDSSAQTLQDLQSEIDSLQAELDGAEGEQSAQTKAAQKYTADLKKIDEEILELDDKRKVLMREENEVSSNARKLETEALSARRTLSHMMDRNAFDGIEAVRRLKEEQGLDGIYGTLAELIDPRPGYETPTEVIGGQSLFDIVVDNDETGTKIIEHLQGRRLGRANIQPLNRLSHKDAHKPRQANAISLLQKLNFDEAIRPAVEQVFGQAIVCPDITQAGDYARTYGVTAVDPEGNQANKRGAYTGGYFDKSKQRVKAIKEAYELDTEAKELKEQERSIRDEYERLNQQITQLKGQQKQLESKRDRAERDHRSLLERAQRNAQLLRQRQEQLEALQQKQQDDVEDYQRLVNNQQTLQTELAAPFRPKLTKEEARQQDQLSSSIPKLRKEYLDVSSQRSELELRKRELEIELRQEFQPRLDQLKSINMGGSDNVFGAQAKIANAERLLTRTRKAVKEAKVQRAEIMKLVEAAEQQLARQEKALADAQERLKEIEADLEKFDKRMTNSNSERSQLTIQADACKRAINDLGMLPENAYEKYRKWDTDKITTRLKKLKASLKKNDHVNKKAFEQYNNFTQQREKLVKRRAELDSSLTAIQDLIAHLDQRKDQAIERTFRQVSKEFHNVFEKLVPAGIGTLIMQRKSDKQIRRPANQQDDASDSEAENPADKNSVQNFTGIGISVSFNSKHNDQQRVQQLSGGQKSLCALALVFAIQRCDPAPFYIFDEIDANLDAQYRTAVAGMIKMLSEPDEEGNGGGQFICTTFSRELIAEADKCYLVTFSNKTSSIDVVYKKDALSFVEGQKKGPVM